MKPLQGLREMLPRTIKGGLSLIRLSDIDLIEPVPPASKGSKSLIQSKFPAILNEVAVGHSPEPVSGFDPQPGLFEAMQTMSSGRSRLVPSILQLSRIFPSPLARGPPRQPNDPGAGKASLKVVEV